MVQIKLGKKLRRQVERAFDKISYRHNGYVDEDCVVESEGTSGVYYAGPSYGENIDISSVRGHYDAIGGRYNIDAKVNGSIGSIAIKFKIKNNG